LQAGIRDLCRGVFPISRVRELEAQGGLAAGSWRALVDAGVFNLRRSEADGGAGLGMTAAVIVFEELGRALVPGPLVGTHVTRTRGAPEEILVLQERQEAVIPYLDVADVVAVLDAEGLWLIRQNEIEAEPAPQPLHP